MSEQHKKTENEEFFEGEYEPDTMPEYTRDEQAEEILRERRVWLRKLSQQDRDFISKYGEEIWKRKQEEVFKQCPNDLKEWCKQLKQICTIECLEKWRNYKNVNEKKQSI